jgi:FdhD protein
MAPMAKVPSDPQVRTPFAPPPGNAEGSGGAPPAIGWTEVPVQRLREGAVLLDSDRLAVEAPLEIRFDGRPFTVLMRTPGHDEELVAGFLFSEGLIRDAAAIRSLGHPESLLEGDCENVVSVELAPAGSSELAESSESAESAASIPGRTFFASASCGVCGKSSIADLAIRAPFVDSAFAIDRRLLDELPARLRAAQPLFAETGGLHGAALFDAASTLLAAREDIGRHNAVDKLIGWALAERRLPLSDTVLMVSGRLGFEIVQKSIVAGIPLVASVGAASSVAVALAEHFGLTLATFVRPGSLNLYGNAHRVTP